MKLTKRNIALLFITAFLVGILGSFIGYKLIQPKNELAIIDETADVKLPESFDQITQAYGMIKQHYIEKVEDKTLVEGAINGMIESLDDPYSTYMDAEMMGEFNEQLESSFQGIGAEVSKIDDKVIIVAPIKDSPAEKAGLRPNDEIVSIEGETVKGLDLNEAVSKIRGEKGTDVKLEIKRENSEPFEIKLTRDDIPVESVYSDIIESSGKKTGMIEITTFSENTAEDFIKELHELEDKGIDGLVIDVRGNPGGLLNSVEDILEEFIPKDKPFMQIEDQKGEVEKKYTQLNEKKPYPISILIDEGSASASEILAVALKEVGYNVIGENSFGKGTVQHAIELDDGMIKLTFFKWLSPEGNWINEEGVTPTEEVKQPDFYYTHPMTVEGTFKVGDEDKNVETAQKMLAGLGYEIDNKKGKFTETTKKSIEAFQSKEGLDKTGELNKDTALAIEKKIIEKIRSGETDLQKEAALDSLYE